MDERLEIHLCKLHNEVFEAAESRINTECSLIICEGISSKIDRQKELKAFPHYMWGYIDLETLSERKFAVPSLYVRVYRLIVSSGQDWLGSLIICEGISPKSRYNNRKQTFPHYMWGYIESYFRGVEDRLVPSLYVRVYRKGTLWGHTETRSLIICEGISSWHSGNFTSPKLPHYMWGYIEEK